MILINFSTVQFVYKDDKYNEQVEPAKESKRGVNRIWRHNFKVTDWLIHNLIYTNVCRKHLVAGFVN
ncbi:hypothetical protein NQ317_017772 [Molorchus minor]|uniref:Uncharacterized protein n=1 Tax=Molorchus minor TaxID=1323400 RepID=A0ABQ9JLA0_9CUCU|nr:hypothetical protein NQ317_017772 [Molorchus minor]